MTRDLSEERETLWALAASPTIWAAHLLVSYCTAAVWCAKATRANASFVTVRIAIGIFTVVALLGIVLVGWRGFRHHRYGDSTLPHDFDSPADRHRFLGFASLLLSGLSAIAVLYEALPAAFIESCR
jgi:hypothetical protein